VPAAPSRTHPVTFRQWVRLRLFRALFDSIGNKHSHLFYRLFGRESGRIWSGSAFFESARFSGNPMKQGVRANRLDTLNRFKSDFWQPPTAWKPLCDGPRRDPCRRARRGRADSECHFGNAIARTPRNARAARRLSARGPAERLLKGLPNAPPLLRFFGARILLSFRPSATARNATMDFDMTGLEFLNE
jgi:hypothetical protein